jgi:hypothetical protein
MVLLIIDISFVLSGLFHLLGGVSTFDEATSIGQVLRG